MRNKLLILILSICSSQFLNAQLYINSAQVTIQTGASIVCQGDVTSNTDILGPGKLVLQGTVNQNVSMSGFTIPNLEINNAANATLTSNARIGTSLLFTNGKILASNFNLNLAPVETNSGMGTSKFVETAGTGQVMQELTANVTSKEIPVGSGTLYRPAFLTTSGTYSSATVGFRVLPVSDPSKPPMISDYITAYWPVTRTGVTGTVTVAGQYINAGDIVGTQANLRGYFYNGTDWTSVGGTSNTGTNQVAIAVTGTGGDVYGMDKFVAMGARAFLQGAYVAATGLMSEGLRTPTLYIPNTDPYRSAPYSGSFTHVNNPTTETVIGTPFVTQATAGNNIVDWVYLELRNTAASPGNTILQTRSALIQRDGDIVDVDGTSPVTFNNIPNGTYALTVRHRNHLAMSLNPSTSTATLTETSSTAYSTNVIDLRLSSASLYGTAAGYTTATHPTLGTVNLLWGGNANTNTTSRYSGAANDRATILLDLGSNELSTLPGYNRSDLNMNGIVKYSGAANDRAFLLASVLGNIELTVRTQQIPN